nr:hypothetical protein [Helicobacter cinaedi]
MDEEVAKAMFKDINVVWEQSGAKEKELELLKAGIRNLIQIRKVGGGIATFGICKGAFTR